MDVSSLAAEHLEAELVAHAAWEATGMARMLAVLAEFDRRRVWETWGCYSPQQWLSWKCGLGYTAATERLRVARALGELPCISAAFSSGKLSWSKVREITRAATAVTDESLCQLAEAATASQVAKVVRQLRRRTPKDAIKQLDNRGMHWQTDDDGSVVITIKLSTDVGMQVVKTIQAAATPVKGTPAHQRRADVFVEMLAGTDELVPAQLVVHAEADQCAIEDGPSITPELADCLGCNGSVTTVLDTPNGPFTLHKDPAPNRAQRRALARWHATCQFPGCHHDGRFDAHHVIGRIHGGKTRLWNLVRLCEFHHRLVHLLQLRCTLHADRRFDVCFPDGKPVDRAISFAPFVAPAPANEDWISGHWCGERLNMDYVLHAIGSREELARRAAQTAA